MRLSREHSPGSCRIRAVGVGPRADALSSPLRRQLRLHSCWTRRTPARFAVARPPHRCRLPGHSKCVVRGRASTRAVKASCKPPVGDGTAPASRNPKPRGCLPRCLRPAQGLHTVDTANRTRHAHGAWPAHGNAVTRSGSTAPAPGGSRGALATRRISSHTASTLLSSS